jgi:phosphoribosyl-ATP pyrophosphohydrolase
MTFDLNTLYQIILDRIKGKQTDSYTATLSTQGIARIAQKVGEESIEVVIEATKSPQNRERIISESADLIFHHLVLLANCQITPEEVFKELEKGHLLKSSTPKDN